MKRSCKEDNSPIIKKKIRDKEEMIPAKNTNDSKKTSEKEMLSDSTVHSNNNSNSSSNSELSVLSYIHELVYNLEQGNIDHCLSNSIDLTPITNTLDKKEIDLFNALESNLKKIAQRQLQLETENLRSRIMIQQQHQLLTTQGHEEKVTPSNHHQATTTNQDTTPEDTLSSIHDSSLLEKLENNNNNNNAGLVTTSNNDTFDISSTANAYPVYFGTTAMSSSILSFPTATVQTSSDNIVCPDCVIQAVKVASSVFNGDLNRRITCQHERCPSPIHPNSPINTLKNAVNAMADRLQLVTDEVTFVTHETAINGKLGVQARCGKEMKGLWRDFVVNLNSMTQNHLEQVRDIADVSTAIARGDLSKAMTVPVRGETLLLKNTFNTMGNFKLSF